jgi:hypothetical protein
LREANEASDCGKADRILNGSGVQEEFMAAFAEQVQTLRRQEQVQQELETCAEDMDKYGFTSELTSCTMYN